MINITAHEIQTPIHIILGYIEVALENNLYKHYDDKNGNYLHIIQKNAFRLQKLVEETLDVARMEYNNFVLHKVNCDICEEIQNMVNEFSDNITENRIHTKTINSKFQHVKILFTKSQPSIFVNIDRLRIYQVISNLINNAINSIESIYDSKKECGSIIISIKLHSDHCLEYVDLKSSNQNCDLGVIRDNRYNDYNDSSNTINSLHQQPVAKPYVIVSVKDSGKGFPVDEINKIFTKFYSFSKKGLGMGLYISKNIVEAHGGKIWCQNVVDCSSNISSHKEICGAVISFSLPIE